LHVAASKCASHPANLSVLLLEAGGPSYSIVGNTDHPGWLNGANISQTDCPGLYNSIYDTTVPSSRALLCNSAINAFGGCTVGGSTAINAGLYFVPPDSDWTSWNISSWSGESIHGSSNSVRALMGNGVTVPSMDGELYLQSSFDVMSKCLSAGGYTEVDLNSQERYNQKTRVILL
jgi:cellobiose dehydrogenase (acceptor)